MMDASLFCVAAFGELGMWNEDAGCFETLEGRRVLGELPVGWTVRLDELEGDVVVRDRVAEQLGEAWRVVGVLNDLASEYPDDDRINAAYRQAVGQWRLVRQHILAGNAVEVRQRVKVGGHA